MAPPELPNPMTTPFGRLPCCEFQINILFSTVEDAASEERLEEARDELNETIFPPSSIGLSVGNNCLLSEQTCAQPRGPVKEGHP